jgi:SOS response regulatory protein OraA/RecX
MRKKALEKLLEKGMLTDKDIERTKEEPNSIDEINAKIKKLRKKIYSDSAGPSPELKDKIEDEIAILRSKMGARD